jgi:hypothetical protein
LVWILGRSGPREPLRRANRLFAAFVGLRAPTPLPCGDQSPTLGRHFWVSSAALNLSVPRGD